MSRRLTEMDLLMEKLKQIEKECSEGLEEAGEVATELKDQQNDSESDHTDTEIGYYVYSDNSTNEEYKPLRNDDQV
nr:unnamed protein product [Naegleria fowleri]